MNPVRRIADDLVEKRLWPIALVLVVALVAIPLFVGGGSSPTAADAELAATPAPAPIESAAPAVELVGPPAVRTRPGKLRDPFRRTKKARGRRADVSRPSRPKSSARRRARRPSRRRSPARSTGGASTKSSGAGARRRRTPADARRPSSRRTSPSLASRSVYETVARVHRRQPRLRAPARPARGPRRQGQPGAAVPRRQPRRRVRGLPARPRRRPRAATTARASSPTRAARSACARATSSRSRSPRPAAPSRHYTLELTSLRRVARGTKSAAQRERQRVAKGGRAALRAFARGRRDGGHAQPAALRAADRHRRARPLAIDSAPSWRSVSSPPASRTAPA